ncbi:flavin reductase family protein [Chloroflexota bacterium]
MKIDPSDLDWREAHHLMVGVVVPRPIALVSTISADGIHNLAAFSCFTPMCHKPTLIGFSVATRRDGSRKDTINNIKATGEFVVAAVAEELGEKMNQASSSYPPEIDEFQECSLTPVKAELVKTPMVGEAPVNIECRLHQVLEFGEPSRQTHFVIGKVLLVHVKDEIYADGQIQVPELKTIARLGGDYYCRTRDLFIMDRTYVVE